MNATQLQSLVVHTGDQDIKRMLMEHSITIQPPTPPNDLAITTVRDSGFVWLVLRFFDVRDPGYVAYGLPESTPEDVLRTAFAFILESAKETASERGIDAFANAQFIELPPITAS